VTEIAPGWLQTWSGDDVVIVPLDDIIVHDVHGKDTCVCGPSSESFEGKITVMWTHHSLDGRENSE